MRLTTYHFNLSCNFTRHALSLSLSLSHTHTHTHTHTHALNAFSRILALLLGYCSNFTLRHRAVWSGPLPVSISYSFCHSPLWPSRLVPLIIPVLRWDPISHPEARVSIFLRKAVTYQTRRYKPADRNMKSLSRWPICLLFVSLTYENMKIKLQVCRAAILSASPSGRAV